MGDLWADDNPENYRGPDGIDKRELRKREMALPPEIRMTNHKMRELRDSYLGLMMLDDSARMHMTPLGISPIQYLAALTTRSNARAELSLVVRELEEVTTPEQQAECKSAAKFLFRAEMEVQRGRRKS